VSLQKQAHDDAVASLELALARVTYLVLTVSNEDKRSHYSDAQTFIMHSINILEEASK
jgi:hypothetical protein